jgi:hypothetical protein
LNIDAAELRGLSGEHRRSLTQAKKNVEIAGRLELFLRLHRKNFLFGAIIKPVRGLVERESRG